MDSSFCFALFYNINQAMRFEKSIIYYISGTGWGHLTRSIQIIRELLKRNIKVIVRTKQIKPLKYYLKDEKVIPIELEEAIEPELPVEYPFDVTLIRENIKNALKEKEKWIRQEIKLFDRVKPVAVISDIIPWPFVISEKFSIPSFAVTNINWWDELTFIIEEKAELEEIKEAYEKCGLAFILPFESNNSVFKRILRVPLVKREINWDRVREKRKNLMVTYRPSLIISVTLGGLYIKNQVLVDKMKRFLKSITQKIKNILIIGDEAFKTEGATFVPVVEFTEFQEIVATSDLVISKIGYGILSEMVTADVVGFLFYRKQILEDVINSEIIKESRWAIVSAFEEEPNPELIKKLFLTEKAPLSKRLKEKGEEVIINRVLKEVN